jgi:hypothetical protein
VRIALADLAIAPVDKELSALISGDLAACIDRVLLGVVKGCCALAAGAPDSPSIFVWNYVLITLCHDRLLRVRWFGWLNWVAEPEPENSFGKPPCKKPPFRYPVACMAYGFWNRKII